VVEQPAGERGPVFGFRESARIGFARAPKWRDRASARRVSGAIRARIYRLDIVIADTNMDISHNTGYALVI